jgi:hypothetical protein
MISFIIGCTVSVEGALSFANMDDVQKIFGDRDVSTIPNIQLWPVVRQNGICLMYDEP